MSTMRKVARIMYIIAMVVAIVGIVTCAVNGVTTLVNALIVIIRGKTSIPFYIRYFLEILYELEPEATDFIYGYLLYYLAYSLIATAFAYFIALVLNIVALVFILKARKNNNSFGLHIATAVIGYFANVFAMVGGILSAIAIKKEERRNAKKEEPKVIDVMAEDIEEVK